jgi:hypothetical protein
VDTVETHFEDHTDVQYHLIFTHLKGPVISRSFILYSINVPADSGTRFDHDPWTGYHRIQ